MFLYDMFSLKLICIESIRHVSKSVTRYGAVSVFLFCFIYYKQCQTK